MFCSLTGRLIFSSERTAIDVNYRLFSPPTSDDSSHDQALTSRVAALNMLDLTLEHLGIEVPANAGSQLDSVVKACGEGEFLYACFSKLYLYRPSI